jgi:hypothetical protein
LLAHRRERRPSARSDRPARAAVHKLAYDNNVGLAITTYDAATGPLRAIYDRMRERPLPAVYQPAHDGVAGIIAMHSLDPLLIPKVFGASSTLNGAGPLAWPERELVNALTSRLNQCFY